MRQVDFEKGKTLNNIIATALPMLVAQILNLLYNIVDRIYIARIPVIGTTALGAVGLCFPIVILITGFTNMYGSGGAPLFSIARGRKDNEEAKGIQNTSFFLLVITAVAIIIFGEIFGKAILTIFGTSQALLSHLCQRSTHGGATCQYSTERTRTDGFHARIALRRTKIA